MANNKKNTEEKTAHRSNLTRPPAENCAETFRAATCLLPFKENG
jgi:hypothetical protein